MKAALNSSRKQGKISKYIYGQFAEHLGRCIYEGLYVEDESIPNKNGMRTDVVNAAALRTTTTGATVSATNQSVRTW